MRRPAFIELDQELHASGQAHDALSLREGGQILFIIDDIGANIVHAALLVIVDDLAHEDLDAQADGALIDLRDALGENEGSQPALASGRKQDIEGVDQLSLRFTGEVGHALLWQPVLRLIQNHRAGKALTWLLVYRIRSLTR